MSDESKLRLTFIAEVELDTSAVPHDLLEATARTVERNLQAMADAAEDQGAITRGTLAELSFCGHYTRRGVISSTVLYLLVVEDDVEPGIHGPYLTRQHRDTAGRKFRLADPEARDGIYSLDVVNGIPIVGACQAASTEILELSPAGWDPCTACSHTGTGETGEPCAGCACHQPNTG